MHTQGRLGATRSTPGAERQLSWFRLLVLLMCWCVTANADEGGSFRVENAHAWITGDVLLLNASFSIQLSSGAKEALENGVPLTLELQTQLVKKHEWFWDEVESEHKLVRRLEYHALSRTYLVKDQHSGTLGNFNRLEDALLAAGTIDRMVITSVPLEPERKYYLRLRGSLDIESLPTPVRLLAYVSSGWDMDSEWYTWSIDR